MTPAEIPTALRDLLDEAAGKTHSDEGPVMACLASILTAHEAAVLAKVADQIEAHGLERRNEIAPYISRNELACYRDAARIARGDR